MNNKGFTLIELLAVVVILGTIMTMAGMSVFGIINKQKEQLAEEMVKNIEDASILFTEPRELMIGSKDKYTEELVLEKGLSAGYTGNCVDLTTLDKADNKTNSKLRNKVCVVTTVKVLKEKGLFEDLSNNCDEDAKIYIYNTYVRVDTELAKKTYGKLVSVIKPADGKTVNEVCIK